MTYVEWLIQFLKTVYLLVQDIKKWHNFQWHKLSWVYMSMIPKFKLLFRMRAFEDMIEFLLSLISLYLPKFE